jgi:asparagine synthase (glutamine-hydrolysing)
MCGIAGVISATDLDDGEIRALERMTDTMVHRGPDSGGLFRTARMAIAMRRLAINDLPGGRQPLHSEDGQVTLVCNGEIYNHRTLRAELEAEGHRFATYSDVETLIHAYEGDADGFLARAKGMYAFALWDARAERLVLGRDRLGEKPLYLWRDLGPRGQPRLWFASEIRTILLVIPPERRRIDPVAVSEFLTFQYVLDPRTPIEGLRKLPAAHRLDLTAATVATAEPRSYWSLRDVPAATVTDPAALVVERFEEACLRMGSADVPVGVALSGGIDSSLVAAVTAKRYPGSIHCFSVGYEGRPATDERAIAERFARAKGLPFTEVEIAPDEIVDRFPDLVGAMDTPIADIAAHGYWAVSRAARAAGVPVLLSGLGGDEVFWGYDWVREAVRRPPGVPAAPRTLWNRLFGVKEGKAAPGLPDSIFAGHPDLTRFEALSRRLVNGVPQGHWLTATRTAAAGRRDVAVCDALNATWLIGNCLDLADRLSMAWSIEMRVPFLDIDLVEGVTAMRQAGLGDVAWPHKGLLLKALGHLLPDEISNRPKQGFTPPVQDWMAALDARWGRSTVEDSAADRHGALDGRELARLWPDLHIGFRHRLMVLDRWTAATLGAQAVPAVTGAAA